MTRERRKYSKEFKMEAILMYENGEQSASEIERELGITKGLLGKWKQELNRQPKKEEAFPGNGRLTEEDALKTPIKGRPVERLLYLFYYFGFTRVVCIIITICQG